MNISITKTFTWALIVAFTVMFWLSIGGAFAQVNWTNCGPPFQTRVVDGVREYRVLTTTGYEPILYTEDLRKKLNLADSVAKYVTPTMLNTAIKNISLTPGPKGDKGDKGNAGDIGPTGSKGDQGNPGVQGIQGVQGTKGDTGLRGLQGDQGIQGQIGATGSTGSTGLKGDVGATGSTGAKGDKGDTGEQGADGTGVRIIGSLPNAGALPPSGTLGDAYLIDGHLWVWSGSAWTDAGNIKGPKGDTGSTGATGATGSTGAKGDQGIQGPQGLIGLTGTQGVQGATGLQGEKGDQGAQGIQGIQGPAGSDATVPDATTSVKGKILLDGGTASAPTVRNSTQWNGQVYDVTSGSQGIPSYFMGLNSTNDKWTYQPIAAAQSALHVNDGSTLNNSITGNANGAISLRNAAGSAYILPSQTSLTNTIVERNASGNFSANVITASLNGTATAAINSAYATTADAATKWGNASADFNSDGSTFYKVMGFDNGGVAKPFTFAQLGTALNVTSGGETLPSVMARGNAVTRQMLVAPDVDIFFGDLSNGIGQYYATGTGKLTYYRSPGGANIMEFEKSTGNLQIAGSMTAPTLIGNLTGSASKWADQQYDASTYWSGNGFGMFYDTDVAKFRVAPLSTLKTALGLGSNAYTSTAYAPLASPALTGTPTAPTATAGTSTTQIATTAFVQNAIPLLASGTYTAVITNGSNVSSSSPLQFFYTRVGNIVRVDGSITINPSASGSCIFRVSLPIPSNLLSTDDVTGQVQSFAQVSSTTYVSAVSNAANFQISLGLNTSVRVSFTYEVK